MEESQILDKPKMYQAVGIINGILELTQSQYSSLIVGEHTYSVTVPRKVEGKYQSGQIQSFKVYPSIIEGKLGFNLLKVIDEVAERSVMVLKGCWTIYEKEPRLIIYRNSKYSDDKTVLQLIWEEAPISTIDKRYWEIEAELKGETFEVIQAIGPFDPPPIPFRKKAKRKRTGDVPRPILKSAKTSMAPIAPEAITEGASEAIEPSKLEPIASLTPSAITEIASEPIASKGKKAVKQNINATKAFKGVEPSVVSEIKVTSENPSESIALRPVTKAIAKGASVAIEPKETETSPVVAEPVIPKKKMASIKPPVSKKLSASPETAEPKKTKEKAKSSSLEKPNNLAGNRLFLGKQLPLKK
jgi:hypothetical protein